VGNLLIVDFYSPSNRGDDALLTSLLGLLREQAPGAAITVHTPYAEAVAERYQVAVRRPLFATPGGSFWRHQLMIRRVMRRPRRGLSPALDDFLDADLVVGMAGGFYNDNYVPDLLGRLAHLALAKRLGKPVAVAAHSFGPFSRRGYRRLARGVLPGVDLLCARDDPSLQVLRDLGVPESRLLRTADPAWTLAAERPECAREILRAESVPTDRPLVTIAARAWRHYRTVPPEEGNRSYVAVMAQAADHAVQAWGAYVLFASTCTDLDGYRTDDRKIGDAILAQMRCADRARVLRRPCSARELAAIYRCAQLHVGTRMHSLIMAAGQATPLVGIAYEPKVRGLLEDLGLPESVRDLEGLAAPALIETLHRAWSARAATAQALPRRVEALAEQARQGVAAICALMREGPRGRA